MQSDYTKLHAFKEACSRLGLPCRLGDIERLAEEIYKVYGITTTKSNKELK